MRRRLDVMALHDEWVVIASQRTAHVHKLIAPLVLIRIVVGLAQGGVTWPRCRVGHLPPNQQKWRALAGLLRLLPWLFAAVAVGAFVAGAWLVADYDDRLGSLAIGALIGSVGALALRFIVGVAVLLTPFELSVPGDATCIRLRVLGPAHAVGSGESSADVVAGKWTAEVARRAILASGMELMARLGGREPLQEDIAHVVAISRIGRSFVWAPVRPAAEHGSRGAPFELLVADLAGEAILVLPTGHETVERAVAAWRALLDAAWPRLHAEERTELAQLLGNLLDPRGIQIEPLGVGLMAAATGASEPLRRPPSHPHHLANLVNVRVTPHGPETVTETR